MCSIFLLQLMFVCSLRVVMERPYWRNEEILAELEGLNITEVINFGIDQLLMDPGTGQRNTDSGTTLLCFVHGNVDDTQVCSHVHVT